MDFEGQREGEKLLFVFRRHVIAMRKGFYSLLTPLAVSSIPPLIWGGDNIKLFILPMIGLGVGMILFLYHLIRWYFTIYIVTDQRIRQIVQRGLFGKDVMDLKLSKIQNISYNIPGFSGEILKFGTITIQTLVGDLIINNVENPGNIYNQLQDAVSNVVGEQAEDEKSDQ